jgi:hypothetical protein
MFNFWKNKKEKTEKEKNLEEIQKERANLEAQLEEIGNTFETQMQSQEKQQMFNRFVDYLSFVNFMMLVKKLSDDPETRKELVNQILGVWEKREKDALDSQRKILDNANIDEEYKAKIESVLRIREGALEETKTTIRFSLKDVYDD